MAKVYRTAKEVTVWLGLESNTSSLALGTALQYYNAFKKEFDSMEYTELLEYSLRSPVLTLGEKHAFLRLFERPWFSRIWIIQEVTAARRATVQCGKLQIPLNVLIRFGEYFKFSGAGNSKWNMEESRILAPIIALAGTMKSKANTRLLTCLFESYVHKATDPRDKIYAVLSRVLPTGVYASRAHLLPYPDYTLSLSDVYIRTARALIEYDQSLQLLSLAPYTQVAAYLAKDEYPSWVPIWSTPVAMLPQLNLLNDQANREVLPSSPVRVLDMAETGDILEGEDFSAGLGWSPALSFRFLKKGKILALPGVRVDEIEQRDSGMPLFNPERTKVWFEECKTAFLGRDPWSDQMSSTREAFWRTCVVYDNIYLSNGAISISGMHRATDELRGISRIPPRDRGEEDILINHISDRLKIFVESPGFMSTFDRASFPFFHRLFQTMKGNIGKGSAGAQKSDIVVVFQGAKVPHVLRKRGDHYRIIGDWYVIPIFDMWNLNKLITLASYLHGIMDGEIVHQQKAGKYEFEEFLIA
ncbi:MAG: hypothetical protein M1822_003784 [Bathelium mastoideum]|nr:MAG: hypothetical protein M1822_003784 [Bathelium mastoideum]